MWIRIFSFYSFCVAAIYAIHLNTCRKRWIWMLYFHVFGIDQSSCIDYRLSWRQVLQLGVLDSRLMVLANTLPVWRNTWYLSGSINNNLLKVWAALGAVTASPYSSNLLHETTRWWLAGMVICSVTFNVQCSHLGVSDVSSRFRLPLILLTILCSQFF